MNASSTAVARPKSTRRRQHASSQQVPRLHTSWQRALIWATWLGWVWLMWQNSANTSMGAGEFLGLFAAIGITVACKKYPLGVPAVFIEKPEDVAGEFESRTNWALVLVGAAILLGGIASTMRIIIHLSTGFATIKDVFNDIGVFIVQWFAERLSGGTYDGELEKTQAYILCVLIIPGVFLVWFNLTPLLSRGRRFKVHMDGSLSVKSGDAWQPIQPRQYAVVTADSTSIIFKDRDDPATPAAIELPACRVFSVERGTRVKDRVLTAWLRKELEHQGYTVGSRSPKGMVETSWIARRAE